MSNHGLFTNCGIFVGGYNITGRSNVVSMTLNKEIKDYSYFGCGNARIKGTGLEAGSFSATGFHDGSLDIDKTLIGTDTPVSLFIPTTGGAAVAAGDNAVFFKAVEAGFTRGAPFGNDSMFTFKADGCQLGYPLGLGYVLNPGLVPVTADNTPAATIVQLTAASATQYVYGVLHVTSVSAGESIVVKIQSDALVGFGTPTDIITFASKAAIGSEYAVRLVGDASGDTFWRAYADVTVAGEPCAITFACAMCIR
jgi:hypothetical protein